MPANKAGNGLKLLIAGRAGDEGIKHTIEEIRDSLLRLSAKGL